MPVRSDELNPEQRAAVTHAGGPVLVVAGAGSGKTLTLACRVAELVRRGVPPERIHSAVCAETMKTVSVPGSLYSVSPAEYHAKSLSPPTPMGASGLSFGPPINPSSETESPVRTFPMWFHLLRQVCGPQLGRLTA
jgi:hypothetical protein